MKFYLLLGFTFVYYSPPCTGNHHYGYGNNGRGDNDYDRLSYKCLNFPWTPFIDELCLAHYPKGCPSPNIYTCEAFQEYSFRLPEIPLPQPPGILTGWTPDDLDIPSNNEASGEGACGTVNDNLNTDKGCWEYFGLGSGGMNFLGCDCSKCTFLSITDNGFEQSCDDANERGYLIEDFSPVINTFALDRTTGEINILSQTFLTDNTGSGIRGLPNTSDGQREFEPRTADCATAIPDNRISINSMDTEGIQRVQGPDKEPLFVIVEENSPSIAFVSANVANNYGRVLQRYVPTGVFDDAAVDGANYPIKRELPEYYAQRFKGRGFEGIACNQISTASGQVICGYKCWAFMQSPLRSSADFATDVAQRSYVYRVLELDYRSGIDQAQVTAEYVIEAVETPTTSYGVFNEEATCLIDRTNTPDDLSVSAAFFIEDTKFAILERVNGQVLYWHVDFCNATNVLNRPFDQVEVFYQDDATTQLPVNDLRANGIIPGTKTLIANSATVRGWDVSYKQNGFALVGNSLVTVGDNDFGIGENLETRVMVMQVNNACKWPHYFPHGGDWSYNGGSWGQSWPYGYLHGYSNRAYDVGDEKSVDQQMHDYSGNNAKNEKPLNDHYGKIEGMEDNDRNRYSRLRGKPKTWRNGNKFSKNKISGNEAMWKDANSKMKDFKVKHVKNWNKGGEPNMYGWGQGEGSRHHKNDKESIKHVKKWKKSGNPNMYGRGQGEGNRGEKNGRESRDWKGKYDKKDKLAWKRNKSDWKSKQIRYYGEKVKRSDKKRNKEEWKG